MAQVCVNVHLSARSGNDEIGTRLRNKGNLDVHCSDTFANVQCYQLRHEYIGLCVKQDFLAHGLA